MIFEQVTFVPSGIKHRRLLKFSTQEFTWLKGIILFQRDAVTAG